MTDKLPNIDYLNTMAGTIIAVDTASCTIELNEQGSKIGRLYKHDSNAFETKKPFDQLPEYQVGKEITATPNNAKHYEKNQILYYLNERWAKNNPWDNLQLFNGDVVHGTVSGAIPGFNSPMAYLVQLNQNHQPDIEVYLPVEDIPGFDGDPLPLKFGDSVKAVVTNAHYRPPQHPKISIKKIRIEQLTEQLKTLDRRQDTFSFLGNNEIKILSAEPQFPLKGKHLVLIDDEQSPINTFTRAGNKLGATIHGIRWRKSFRDEDIVGQLNNAQDTSNHPIDLIVIDDTLGKPTTGLNLLERLAEQCPDWHFVLASSFYTPETISKLEANSRKKITAIHKPIRLASLLAIFDGNSMPREFVESVKPQIDVQELIIKAESALHSAVGSDNAVEIMAFSLHEGDKLSGIGDSSQRLSAEDKAKWVNDPYFRVLIQEKSGTLQLNRKENPALSDMILQRDPRNQTTKNYSQWHVCKVESQHILIGHCFKHQHTLSLKLGEWMAEQLARRLWSWHWREAIAPTMALGQQAASIAHELVGYSDKAHRSLELLRRAFSDKSQKEDIPQQLNNMEMFLQNSRDTYAALVGSTASEGEWSFRSAGEDVINMLKPLCEKRDIRIELVFPEISIPCPKSVLQLALHNLISNAIKHHFDESDVQEKLLITVTALSDYNTIDIQVQDNGPGIPKHVEENLYDFGDSFMQAANKENTEQSHGIGLWLAKKLMAKFEGELFHETARGIGTTFTLRLPLTVGAT